MHLHEITAASLTKTLGVEVPDIYVVIAKHSVLGMDSEGIRGILQCDADDILEVESTELYKTIRAQVAGAYANLTVSQTTGWDAIEQTAIDGLMKRLPFEKDGEFLLRVAAVANKATRRVGASSGVLDPSRVIGRTAITLTQRLVQRLNRSGDREQITERTLSIHDGSMANPTFDEVDSLLSVKNEAVLPRGLEIQTRNADPSMDELMGEMLRQTS